MMMFLSSYSLSAQKMSLNMARYYEGCMLLREAVNTQSFSKLLNAKLILDDLDLAEAGKQYIVPIDSISASVIEKPTIFFTSDYANYLAESETFTLENLDDAHLMREGDAEILLWHASIKPHSVASFKSYASDNCEILLVPYGQSTLQLSISLGAEDSIKAPTISKFSDLYISWLMPTNNEEFIFTISNDSDEPTTFVIAFN